MARGVRASAACLLLMPAPPAPSCQPPVHPRAPPPCPACCACCAHRHVFHGVHMLLQFSSSAEGAGRAWQAGETRMNKIVFIGKNLDRKALTDAFMACLAAK